MINKQRLVIPANAIIISAILVLNFFYQKNGFDFTLKCICSGAFAALGLLNLVYALSSDRSVRRFCFAMATGLLLAFLGDVLIGYNFVVGAATFAAGHVCFAVAYCFFDRLRLTDLLIGGVLFVGGTIFLLVAPFLTFDEPSLRAVCIAYALIISVMLGKALGNFIRSRTLFTATVAIASALFFFSDLMLVLDWFVGRWSWTDHACMGTYYPALCLLALSMLLRVIRK